MPGRQPRRFMLVAHSIEDDERFTGLGNTDWGVYYRLRNLADTTYPDPAPLPRWVTDADLQELERRALLQRMPGDRFRLPELDAHREEESERNSLAGKESAAKRALADVQRTSTAVPEPGNSCQPTGRNGTGQDETGRDQRWVPFLNAWAELGLSSPPTEPQRQILWGEGEDHGAVRDWPNACGQWVREAPAGSSPNAVVDFVLRRYHAKVRETRQQLAEAGS